jgi:CRISPR-associated protein Csd2
MSELMNRIDFVYIFDVQDGNPNGDPDAGNLPRVDAETGMGLVTDVCLKRKVRNYVQVAKDCAEGYDIFIKEKAVLNKSIDAAHEEESVKKATDKISAARDVMCRKFFDIRTFGAVMSTGKNAGQVRGPIQLTFARSVDPIAAMEHSITRMAVATEKEAEKQGGDNRTMGRKATVPYGLYVCHGFISANLAKQTGFSEEDLALFWDALKNMFDVDRSAARGLMSAQKLIVFKHDSVLGNAPADKLFKLVKVEKKEESKVPRSVEDYNITSIEDIRTGLASISDQIEVEELI